MRSTRLAALGLATLSVVALAAPDAPPTEDEGRPPFDNDKVILTARKLANEYPYRTTKAGKAPVLAVLGFVNGIYDLKFRVEVSRDFLDRQNTATTPDDSRTLGQALEEILADCDCEYGILPDGTVLIRRKSETAAWTLDSPDGRKYPR